MQVFHSALRHHRYGISRAFDHPVWLMRLREALVEAFVSQRAEWFLWIPVFMGAGIIAYFTLPFEPGWILIAPLILCALTGGYFLWRQHILRGFILFLMCASVGFSVAKLRTAHVYTPILQKELKFADVIGRVNAVEVLSAGGMRVILEELQIEDIEPEHTPRKIRVKSKKAQHLRAGMRVKVLAGLNPPSPPVMPGGFDFQRYMFFQGIGAVGFTYGAFEVLESPETLVDWRKGLENIRTSVSARAVDALERSGGVAAALLVGQREGISEDDEDAMRHSGLAHMLAISGLHIGLIFGFVFFAVRLGLAGIQRLALEHPIKKYAAVAGMVVAVFYMFIAGATIPTQRAVLMISIVFLAILVDRTPLSMRLVAFSAIIVLLIAPYSLLSASFQMSFAAVAALVAFYEFIRTWWSAWHKKAGWLRRAMLYVVGVCFTSIVATIATAPFTLFHFQQIGLYGLLGNLLAIPLLAFVVMPMAVVFFILSPFGLQSLALIPMGFGIEGILKIAHFVSGLPHSVQTSYSWPAYALLIYAIGFLCILLFKGRLRLIGFIPVLVCIFIISQLKQPDILISSDAQLIAMHQDDGSLSFSNLRKDRFIREQWAQGAGVQYEEPQKWLKEGGVKGFACGQGGCRLERNGHRVSFLKTAQAFDEECAWADIVVSPDPVPDCGSTNGGARVIDRF